jgi:hypothetical protein
VEVNIGGGMRFSHHSPIISNFRKNGEKEMQIKFKGLVTKEEYDKVIKFQNDRALRPAKIIVLSIFVLRIIYFLVNLSCRTTLPKISSILAELPLLIFLTFPWWIPLFNKRNKYGDPLNPYNQPISGNFSDVDFSMVTFLMDSTIRWEGVTKYWNNEDFLVLYYRGLNITPLPRSLFSSKEDWDELITFLENRYPKKKRIGN